LEKNLSDAVVLKKQLNVFTALDVAIRTLRLGTRPLASTFMLANVKRVFRPYLHAVPVENSLAMHATRLFFQAWKPSYALLRTLTQKSTQLTPTHDTNVTIRLNPRVASLVSVLVSAP
jgi:hypothetical protein